MDKPTNFGKGDSANICFFISSAFVLYAGIYGFQEGYSLLYKFILYFLMFAAGGFFSWLGSLIAKDHHKENQALRDSRAQKILGLINAEEVPRYSLYLRPFEPTEKISYEDSYNSPFDSYNSTFMMFKFLEEKVGFDKALAEVMEPEAPLITAGKTGSKVGAGRIQMNEENWKEEISELAKNAFLLFVVPSNHPGTLWEIEWIIRNQLLWKTIFLMPPEISKNPNSFSVKNFWATMHLEVSQLGLEIPKYTKKGAIFIYENNGQVSKKILLGNSSSVRFNVTINRLLIFMSKKIKGKN